MTDWLEQDWLGLGGRAALVAGAGGIGEAIALALARAGARVVVTDVSEPRLAEVAKVAAAESLDIAAVAADLTSASAARQAVSDAAALLGGLDVFVHAVGANDRRPVLDTPDEVWERIIDVNLKSAVWTAQAAGALMVAAGYGRIVFLSSVSGLLAHADHAPYAATKGGVNQLCRVMAREWAAHGVTVNAVAPGAIRTRAHDLITPAVIERIKATTPAGYIAEPEDVASCVAFLASEDARYVTGQTLLIDGGRWMI